MGKAHSNKGRYFKFNNSEELERFILLYENLFTPYSKDVLSYKKNYYDYNISDLERGFERFPFDKDNFLKVNLTKESLDKILESRCFRKESWTRGRNVYILI